MNSIGTREGGGGIRRNQRANLRGNTQVCRSRKEVPPKGGAARNSTALAVQSNRKESGWSSLARDYAEFHFENRASAFARSCCVAFLGCFLFSFSSSSFLTFSFRAKLFLLIVVEACDDDNKVRRRCWDKRILWNVHDGESYEYIQDYVLFMVFRWNHFSLTLI